jgi:hypothetical protein
MANNIAITSGSGTTLKTTDNAGVHTPHHNIDVIASGSNFIGAVKTRFFAAAAATVTRPANTTAYSVNDAVSNNAAAGSVTPISFSVSNVSDDPVSLERVRILSTDTGLVGQTLRMFFYQTDPSASSGIVGGDNAAFSTKQGTFIGTMSGTLRAFSDGAGGVLTPDEGSRIITNPTGGAQTVFGLLQTLTAWTPSANSTTIVPTVEGFQGRA